MLLARVWIDKCSPEPEAQNRPTSSSIQAQSQVRRCHVSRGSIVGQCQYSWCADQNNPQIWVARHDQWPTRECIGIYKLHVVHDGEASTWCIPRGGNQNAQAIITIMSSHCRCQALRNLRQEEHTHYGTCVLHTAGEIEGGCECKLILGYAIAGCGRASVVASQGSLMVATMNVRMILVLIVRYLSLVSLAFDKHGKPLASPPGRANRLR